jgi:hypothetical protein
MVHRSVRRGVRERLTRYARALYYTGRFIQREIRSDSAFPLGARLACTRRGFYSDKLALYDFSSFGHGSYLSDLQFIIGTGRLNGDHRFLLNDKLAFHWLMSSAQHARPALFAHVDEGRLRYLERGSREHLECHLETGKKLVLKPTRGGGGRGVQIWPPAGGAHGTVEQLAAHVADLDQFIVVEFVQQARYAREIFEPATNTIRMLTMREGTTDETFLAAAAHRFGTSRSKPMDNFSAGGLTADIDLGTGVLGRAAIRASTPHELRGLTWLDHHPDSGAPISGTVIPNWPDVAKGVVDIADRLPYLPYLGWDIVVTDDGFRVIEANNTPDPRTLQIHRPLLNDERTRAYYEGHGIVPTRPTSEPGSLL